MPVTVAPGYHGGSRSRCRDPIIQTNWWRKGDGRRPKILGQISINIHVIRNTQKRKCKAVTVQALKAYWGTGVTAPFIRRFGTRWRWSATRSSHFTPDIHWTAGWVGPRAGLKTSEKRKIFRLYQESNSRSPAYSLVAIPTELSRLPLIMSN